MLLPFRGDKLFLFFYLNAVTRSFFNAKTQRRKVFLNTEAQRHREFFETQRPQRRKDYCFEKEKSPCLSASVFKKSLRLRVFAFEKISVSLFKKAVTLKI